MEMKKLSLVERKKLQWTKEREELSHLSGLWSSSEYHNANNTFGSTNCVCHIAYPEKNQHRDQNLPPLQHFSNNSEDNSNQKLECDTSGYDSETDTKEVDLNYKNSNVLWRSQSSLTSDTGAPNSNRNDTFDNGSCRIKWGDRGLNIGDEWLHLSDKSVNQFPQICETNSPQWLQRSLTNSTNKTYLRGQNVPIEVEVLAEREQKRLKAIKVQDAIKQQLEEREQKRKLEQELKIEEDRKLEERIKIQQEVDKLRVEEEIKKLKEKEENDMRKQLALREAIENAEQKAKEDKNKFKSKSKWNKTYETCTNNNMEHTDEHNNLEKPTACNMKQKIDIIDEFVPNFKSAECQTVDYFHLLENNEKVLVHKCTQTTLINDRIKLRRTPKLIVERPKWGVNKPDIRYIKQSEKDPFYQRKLRYRLYKKNKQYLRKNEKTDTTTSFEDRYTSTSDESGVSTSPSTRAYTLTGKYRKNIDSINISSLKNRVIPDILQNLSSLKQNLQKTLDNWNTEYEKMVTAIDRYHLEAE